jgi:transcriptional regulator with XRE-family HTH domain
MTQDPALERRRRGFWLRMARERAGLSQQTVAKDLGLSSNSKSTMSAWEAGKREIPTSKLAAMARLYGVPVSRLTDPQLTAFEMIDEWLSAAVAAASALEREDWVQAGEATPGSGDEPGAGPDRRSA